MKNKNLSSIDNVEEFLLKPYTTPHTICISTLPSAKKIRMAAVNINASIFLKESRVIKR